MGWNLCEGLFYWYCNVILYIVRYFDLWLNGLFIRIFHHEVDILVTCVHSKSYVIHSHSCRDPCSDVGIYFEWAIAEGAGMGTST